MKVYIDDNSTHNHFYIDDVYKLFLVKNVHAYSLINNHTTLDIHVSPDTISDTDISYYLVIDFMMFPAFGHWVLESAIYLPIFAKLKEIYSNVKVLLNGRKEYKTLFLQFFTIPPSDVVYREHMSVKNVCFFPSPISPLNDIKYFTEDYRQILNRFIHVFHTYTTDTKYEYDCIVLPRQTKENYRGNDRSYDMLPIYTFLNNTQMSYKVFHTDETTDLAVQIQTLRSSPNILLTDGSPFLVNSMFCRNSKIAVLDTLTRIQAKEFVKLHYIIETACNINKNTIEYVPVGNEFLFQVHSHS